MKKKFLVRILLLIFMMSGCVGTAPAPTPSTTPPTATATSVAEGTSGPLFVNPDNPRYFTDGTKINGKYRSIYLTGSHTWCNFSDCGDTNPPPPFDYAGYLDFLEENHLNLIRLWREENTIGGVIDDFWFSIMPYQRTGPGAALDGGPKYDLTKFDQAYFDRLRDRVIAARDRGIYVSVMLFNGWSVESHIPNHDPWPGHPYHPDNNINAINGDSNNNGQGDEVDTLQNPAILDLQESYIRKVIDTVNDLDNVLYEISNESNMTQTSHDWQYHMVDYIKDYEAGKPRQHPVGLTVERFCINNGELFTSDADWVSPCFTVNNPEVADSRKVILADTDHPCGVCGDMQWVWKSFTRGLNPLFMDPYSPVHYGTGAPEGYDPNNANDVSIRKSLGYTRAYADRMNLTAMTPQPELCSTGYCLANSSKDGAEYLVFLPAGATITKTLQDLGINKRPELYLPGDATVEVDLSAASGELVVEWFNPETGETTQGESVTGGVSQTFTAPFTGNAVLYIYDNTP